MLRAAQLSTSRATQPMVNILSKRFQQTSTSSSSSSTPSPSASPSTARPTSTSTTGTGSTQFVSATKDSSTATKTQTTSSPASSSSTTTGGTTKKSTSAGVPPSLPPRSNVPPGSSGGGNAGSYIKTGALGLGIGLGIGLLYSEYENDKFRRKFENMVPLSSTILGGLDKVIDPVFGRKKSLTTQAVNAANKAYDQLPEYKTVKGAVTGAAEQAKDLANKAYDQLPDSKTVKKNLSSAKEQMDDAAKSVQKGISTTKDQMDDAAKSVQKGISTVKDQAADVKKRLTKGKSGAGLNDPMFEEEPGEAGDLVPPAVPKDKLKSLEDELGQMFTPLTSTLDSTMAAIREHISHMKNLIDSGTYSSTPSSTSTNNEVWQKAEQLQKEASSAYDKASNEVKTWKEKVTGFFTSHPEPEHTPEMKKLLAEYEKAIDDKFNQVKQSYTSSSFVTKFRSYIDEATQSFQKEIETMFPSIASKTPTQLNPEDLQALLAHAHRRVAKLQDEIARMRVNEADSVKAAIEVAKGDVDKVVQAKVDEALAQTTEQLSKEVKTYESNLRAQFDEQLKREIVLQHQALSQYLADVLSRQYDAWTREYEKQLDQETIKIRLDIQRELKETLDRVKAIEEGIDANVDSERRGRQAQQLWIQAQNVLHTIVHGGDHLVDDLDTIARIVPDERFVQVLVAELKQDSHSPLSPDEPVINEESLRERFHRVKKLCRRVALIDEQHNSLLTYFLSYLQSLFIFRNYNREDSSILRDDTINLDHLNTFSILDYVQSYLEHDQWYNALRLMQLLSGEAKQAAQSWIRDTRAYLAKKQTSELLEAYSNSIGLGSLPRETPITLNRQQ